MKKENKISQNYLEKKPIRTEGIGWSKDEEDVVTLEIVNKGVFNFIAKAFLGDFILLALVIITLVALGGLYLFILGKYYKKVNEGNKLVLSEIVSLKDGYKPNK